MTFNSLWYGRPRVCAVQNVGGSWPPRLKNSLSGGGYVELSSFEHGPPTTTDWKSALAAAVAELLYTTVVRLPSPPRTTCYTAVCVEDSLEQLIHGCAARASNGGGGSAARAAALNRGAVEYGVSERAQKQSGPASSYYEWGLLLLLPTAPRPSCSVPAGLKAVK